MLWQISVLMLTINSTLDTDTAMMIAREFGANVEMRSFEQELLQGDADDARPLQHPQLRPRVVVVEDEAVALAVLGVPVGAVLAHPDAVAEAVARDHPGDAGLGANRRAVCAAYRDNCAPAYRPSRRRSDAPRSNISRTTYSPANL